MLVISRKGRESFLVGDDIEIVVYKVQGQRVTLGIVAPQDKRIIRTELVRDKSETNVDARKR